MSRAQVSHQAEFKNLIPYRSEKEFMMDLQSAIEEDYGVTLIGTVLEESKGNLNQYLQSPF